MDSMRARAALKVALSPSSAPVTGQGTQSDLGLLFAPIVAAVVHGVLTPWSCGGPGEAPHARGF